MRHKLLFFYGMTLREQKRGFQEPWKLEELSAGLRHFFKKYGRYPTATEIDQYPYLPSARSVERSFGGLVELRRRLTLGKEHDFRTGAHSSKRAHTILNRAHEVEARVHAYLIKRFGREFVHREYFFTDDHRTRADFFVYDAQHGFCVDVFYPSTRRNLTGCLNIKLKKYRDISANLLPCPIIFLQMNEKLDGDNILEDLLKKKKHQLEKRQYLMGWEEFASFCDRRKALKI